MTKILLLEDDPELLDRIAFVLESIPGVVLERAIDRKSAAQLIQEHKGGFDLLVIDYHYAPLNSLGELQKLASEIDCIFCIQGEHPATPGWKTRAFVDRNVIASQLRVTVEKWRSERPNRDAKENTDGEAPKYCRIKTKLLVDVSPLYADIYAKLSDTKFIKVFQKSDVFDRDDFTRYAQQKKIEYMYLSLENCKEFVEKYIVYIENWIRGSKVITVDEVSYLHASIHESVQELTDKMGFTREVQALAKSQVQLTVKAMGKKPILKKLLQKLESQSGQYLADHSFLTGYIACGIASQMEWSSEITYHKLTLAAFMHDVVLSDPLLAECETMDSAKAVAATPELLKEFQRHPYKVAELVRQMSEIPPDVDAIILQHHERPDGSGFPRGIQSSYIAPLSSVFIVAHDMAKTILEERGRFSVAAYVQRRAERYQQASFKKILQAAGELIID